jgi:histone arginine demethylase JMJD6
VTQNFCSTTNLEYVWLKTRFSRPKMAAKLKLLIQNDLEIKKSDREIKDHVRLRHPKTCLKTIEILGMVPMLPTSSSGSSSSSSSESGSDSDQSVVCQCHGKKRRLS